MKCEVVEKIQTMLKISNKVSDEERHYLNNLIISARGELPDEDGKVSENATHVLVVDKGFIVAARKVIRGRDEKSIDKLEKL